MPIITRFFTRCAVGIAWIILCIVPGMPYSINLGDFSYIAFLGLLFGIAYGITGFVLDLGQARYLRFEAVRFVFAITWFVLWLANASNFWPLKRMFTMVTGGLLVLVYDYFRGRFREGRG